MNNKITYNLSSIPGFTNFIQSDNISSEFEKYYTYQQ